MAVVLASTRDLVDARSAPMTMVVGPLAQAFWMCSLRLNPAPRGWLYTERRRLPRRRSVCRGARVGARGGRWPDPAPPGSALRGVAAVASPTRGVPHAWGPAATSAVAAAAAHGKHDITTGELVLRWASDLQRRRGVLVPTAVVGNGFDARRCNASSGAKVRPRVLPNSDA
jgi:hypothetical protein